MALIDQSIETVRSAVRRFGKKPLADRVELTDSIVRNVHDRDWDPRASTLRRLEEAANELEAEHGPAQPEGHRESAKPNPRSRRRA